MDPTTQGTEPAQQSQTEQTQQPLDTQPLAADPRFEGLQKRLDELTGGMRAAERTAAELQQQNAELQRALVEMTSRAMTAAQPRQPETLPVPESMDPTVAQFLQTAIKQNTEQLARQFAAQQAALQQQIGASELDRSLANAPPAVQKYARAQYDRWMSDPHLKHIVNPMDAVRFAYGEAAMRGELQPAKAGDPGRAAFNAGASAPLPPAPAPNPSAAGSQQYAGIPADFDTWPMSKQDKFMAEWEAKYGDQPIE